MGAHEELFSFADHSLDDALIDLGVRFVLNCPPEDISTAVRLFFQLEEAHWFYEDFVREQNPALPSFKMKHFITQLYRAIPLMSLVCAEPNVALTEFQSYKSSIPVRGGILVNKALDKVLMVRSWKGNSWGFPRGKINKEEDDAVCAIREVFEETGFDMESLLDRKEFIEITYGGKNIRLYVVSGVPEETHFETRTRKEISRIQWIPVRKLPVFNRKTNNSLNFYMVTPFMNGLKSYIGKKKGFATKLSESETGALKNMLGISLDAPATVHNDEATAQHLLAMLRGSAAAPAADSNAASTDSTLAAPPPIQAVQRDPVGGMHAKDRDILLNLLKEGTPEPEHKDSQESKEDVESAREILALLQREMATEKAVSTPPTLPSVITPPLEPTARPAQAPALPPNWMLESLVSSRKSNPGRKQASFSSERLPPSAPASKNALLNILSKPKQAESAKLMALLKPVKPPPAPSPRRSALMDLLERTDALSEQDLPAQGGPVNEVNSAAIVETDRVGGRPIESHQPQAPGNSPNDERASSERGRHNGPASSMHERGVSDAAAPKKAPKSSLLNLLQSEPEPEVLPTKPAPSPRVINPALSAEPSSKPLHQSIPMRDLDADQQSVQRESVRSVTASEAKTERKQSNALLSLLSPHQDESADLKASSQQNGDMCRGPNPNRASTTTSSEANLTDRIDSDARDLHESFPKIGPSLPDLSRAATAGALQASQQPTNEAGAQEATTIGQHGGDAVAANPLHRSSSPRSPLFTMKSGTAGNALLNLLNPGPARSAPTHEDSSNKGESSALLSLLKPSGENDGPQDTQRQSQQHQLKTESSLKQLLDPQQDPAGSASSTSGPETPHPKLHLLKLLGNLG